MIIESVISVDIQFIDKISKLIKIFECIRLLCKSYRDCMEKFFVDKTKHPNARCEICCCKYDSVSFEKNNECFCYCYKQKRISGLVIIYQVKFRKK